MSSRGIRLLTGTEIKLQGFNNLTKSLSICIYDICYAKTREQKEEYIAYIDERYNADRLTEILTEVCDMMGANLLNVPRQDYDRQRASVTILTSEELVQQASAIDRSERPGPLPDSGGARRANSH